MATIVISRPDNETVSVWVRADGGTPTMTEVACATHDDHGWAGIHNLIQAVRELGAALNVPVVEER